MIADHYAALEPVAAAFRAAGLYAYRTPDAENRWSVACDLEDGHIDVRIGADGYELDVWASSPGMFVDQEDERRRAALERLARISLPGIRRGFLEEHQSVEWDEHEHGIAVRNRYQVPFSAGERLPQIALERLSDVNDLLRYLEQRLVS
jgi:hypothetical protein